MEVEDWLEARITRFAPKERVSVSSMTLRSLFQALRERTPALFAAFRLVDLDVHQGDGTAKIFESDADVFTASVHGSNNFPFRKQSSSVDAALPDGVEDDEYLQAVEKVVPLAIDFRPDILFFQSGVDGLASDVLGRLSLTCEGLLARDRIVFSACRNAGVPCVITLGGGYSDPIERTVEAHANTFRTAVAMSARTYSK